MTATADTADEIGAEQLEEPIGTTETIDPETDSMQNDRGDPRDEFLEYDLERLAEQGRIKEIGSGWEMIRE